MSESDRIPLDEDYHHARQLPLSAEELRRLRKLLIADDRATWATRQFKIVIIPLIVAIVAVVTACYNLGLWVASHWKS
jgi:hypothetical protein